MARGAKTAINHLGTEREQECETLRGYIGPYRHGLHKVLERNATPEHLTLLKATQIGQPIEISAVPYLVADLYLDDLRRLIAVAMPFGSADLGITSIGLSSSEIVQGDDERPDMIAAKEELPDVRSVGAERGRLE